MTDLTLINNRYLIHKKIGDGSHGEVYRAYDKNEKRHVAVKVLEDNDDVSEDEREKFRLEFEALSKLNHPAIARTFSLLQDGNARYIVSEYQEGISLLDFNRRNASLKQLLLIFLKVSDGLSVAHRNDIVHGDLHWRNILVNNVHNPKIVDFGLHHCDSISTPKKQTELLHFYKNIYSAPECIEGKKPSPQSDIYSLGVMVYHMLIGNRKVLSDSKSLNKKNKLFISYVRNNSFKYDVPITLTTFLDSCLAINPNQRPKSATEFSLKLKSLIDMLPEENESPLAFTHFYPAEMPLNDESNLLVYVHLEELLEQVRNDFDSRRKSSPINHSLTITSADEFKRGTKFKIVPNIESTRIIPSSLDVEWIDDIERVKFVVKPSKTLTVGAGCVGNIRVFAGAGIIAELPILFSTCPAFVTSFNEHTNLPYKKVFLSYSHKDANVVRAVEQLYSKFADLDTFIDYRFLDAGNYWWNKVQEKIEESDALQLFWSENSSQSENVEKEWRYALKLNRPIIPIMLSPETAIPEPLQPIHFEPFDQFISAL